MLPDQIKTVFMKTDPFELLPDEKLEELSRRAEVKTYPEGTYIFRQDNPSLDVLFVIASGLAEITVTNERGVESVVGVRRPYDFFGETVVLSRQRYPGSVRAREALVCCLVKRTDLEALIYNNRDFSGFFNALLAERMRLLYTEIVAEQSYETYASVPSPRFHQRVSEVMSRPVITCQTSDPVVQAARKMAEKGISALLVLGPDHAPRGILTEKAITHRLVAERRFPIESCRVEQIMNSNLAQIPPQAFLGQGLATMMREGTKYLIVTEREAVMGILTLFDLIKTPETGSLLLAQEIESRQRIEDLAKIGRQVDPLLSSLLAERASVREILEIMSEIHERMTRAVIRLSEERMKREVGPPPTDYCWINMGSAARHEQTLRTDQDNAIIYEDPPEEEEASADGYFEQLAEYAVEGLFACGFAKCRGDVMATNPKWRRSLSAWVEAIQTWTRSYDPEDTRNLTILLDFRPVWGNMTLATRFWEEIFSAFQASPSARHMLTKDDLQYKLPLSFLGSFVTEKSEPHKNEIDLKKSGSAHIVNGVRIFALENRITEPSTLGRLDQLAGMGAMEAEDAELFGASFEAIMMLRIRENMKKFGNDKPADNYVAPDRLSKREKMILKDALSSVGQLQKLIEKEFSVPWLQHYV